MADATLAVWDLATGARKRVLSSHASGISALAVTPDGLFALSASEYCDLIQWDLRTGSRVKDAKFDLVQAIAITPDQKRSVLASLNMTATVLDFETGQELFKLRGHSDGVRCVAVSPNGEQIITGSDDATLKTWDMKSGKELLTLRGHTEGVVSVAVTPDSTCALSASSDATVKVWDLQTGEELHTLRGHSGAVTSVAVLPGGTRGISCSCDKTIKIWDLESGSELAALYGHTGEVWSLAVSSDGRLAISISEDETLRVWFPTEATGGLSPLDEAHNAELAEMQKSLRFGVRTPEFYFSRHFDNSRLVKAPDPIRFREIQLFSAATSILFSLVMIYGLQHFYAIETGYRVEAEKAKLDELREERAELLLERARLLWEYQKKHLLHETNQPKDSASTTKTLRPQVHKRNSLKGEPSKSPIQTNVKVPAA